MPRQNGHHSGPTASDFCEQHGGGPHSARLQFAEVVHPALDALPVW